MTSTSTRTSRAAAETVSGGARSAGSQALRAAGRQLVATAGNQVLKAAVDRVVGKVDDVAGRLDAVASGERRKPSRPPTSRKPPQRPAPDGERQSGNPVRVKVGAAFNLVLQQAMRLLQLIQRLAQQLLAALTRLFHLGDDAASTQAETESPSVEPAAPRKQVDKPKRPVDGSRAEGARPAAGQPARAPQAPRRQGPRPAAREAVSAPRRVAGDRPVRAARND
jgi:hypothetical protein